MFTKRKKITKKQIKEDKLVTSYYEAKTFYQENQSKILIGLGVIAFVIVAIIWYSNKSSENNTLASVELNKVMPLYDSGAYQEAIDGKTGTNILGLKKIVDSYSGSENGELARIYLANAYYFLGKFDEALENYEDYSGSNELLTAAALAGTAACYEAKEKYEDAAHYYEKAFKVNEYNSQNAEYLLKAGADYIKVQKFEEAQAAFDIIKEKYKTTQAFRELDRYLVLLPKEEL
ncbi:MAG: tetratricopeptide repeat protein [Ignavibacteriales bacterium]